MPRRKLECSGAALILEYLKEGGKIKYHEKGIQLDWDGFLWTVQIPKECWLAQLVIFICEGIQELMNGREKYEHDEDCNYCKTVTHHQFYYDGSTGYRECLTCGTRSSR